MVWYDVVSQEDINAVRDASERLESDMESIKSDLVDSFGGIEDFDALLDDVHLFRDGESDSAKSTD